MQLTESNYIKQFTGLTPPKGIYPLAPTTSQGQARIRDQGAALSPAPYDLRGEGVAGEGDTKRAASAGAGLWWVPPALGPPGSSAEVDWGHCVTDCTVPQARRPCPPRRPTWAGVRDTP